MITIIYSTHKDELLGISDKTFSDGSWFKLK